MILVMTALDDILPKDKCEEILFLGEWCKLYTKRERYKDYNYKTLEYHWDNRKKLYEDVEFIDILYERYLKLLKDNLNEIHNVYFSISYWRIILGPWLRYFIEIVYDRYLSIMEAYEKKIDYVNTVSIKDEDVVPCDMYEFDDLYTDDLWNQFIYQNIIKHFDIKPINLNMSLIQTKIKNTKIKNTKIKIKENLFALNKCNTIHFFSPYIKLKDLSKLQISLLQVPTFATTIDINIKISYSVSLRNKIIFQNMESSFEKILSDLIKKQIPKYYLEGYKDFRNKVLKKYPKKAKVILTANAYSSDDAFKLWVAEKKEEGSKYIISQHGGNYGMGLFSSQQKHQIKSADKFFSWGWDNVYETKIVPVSAIKLKHEINYKYNGDILIVLTSFPRYNYTLMAMPIAGQALNYIDNQVDYINLVSKKIKNLLKLRLYHHDYGWNFRERFNDAGFNKLIDNKKNLKKTLHNRLSKCRLCIVTYNATTYLETFSANYPTLLYWNPLHWELREEAKNYFDLLEDVGILHYTPESLYLKLNEIYENPLSWWSQKKIQTAKDKFCYRFANKNNNYLIEYKKEINNLLNL